MFLEVLGLKSAPITLVNKNAENNFTSTSKGLKEFVNHGQLLMGINVNHDPKIEHYGI